MEQIRIIPRLDIKGPHVVKGIHCEGLRVVGKPSEMAHAYYEQGADELLYLDIVASLYQRDFDIDQFRSAIADVFVPITAGGGIRSIADIERLLRSGADKVAINTYAIRHPEFIASAAHRFGSQCIVLSVEAKRTESGSWEAYTDGGRERTGVDALEWIERAVELGAGEILLTSVDRDGTRRGFDAELASAARQRVSVPIIVSGGAQDAASIEYILRQSMADAVGVASMLHYRNADIPSLKRSLHENGINVRLS